MEGARAVLLQHETPQFIDRINAFLGFGAVGELRIMQKPLAQAAPKPVPAALPLTPAQAAALDEAVAGMDDELAQSLKRLGEGVLTQSIAQA